MYFCNILSRCSKWFHPLTQYVHPDMAEQEEDGHENLQKGGKKIESKPAAKPDVPVTQTNAAEPERSDSDESDDSD